MQILIVIDRRTGGVPVTTIDLARGLAESGCQVTLLADPIDGADLLPAAIAAGVRHLPWAGQTSLRGLVQLLRTVLARRWRAVLSVHRGCDVAVAAACALAGRPHAIALHGDPMYEAGGTTWAGPRRALWRWAAGRSGAFIAISAFLAGQARRFFPRLPPVSVVHDANARTAPATSPVAPPEPGGEARLVACGRLYDAKHPELLRPLVQALERRGVRCAATWIGGGDGLQALAADAAAHGLAGRVRFPGHRDDPWDELRAAHLLVHFCTIEGFGLVIVEAFAAGLPVAAFAAGALPELVQDGREGVLVPPGPVPAEAVDALAERIAPLLRDPARHAAAAAAALVRAGDFTRSACAAGYRRALESMP